MAKSIKEKQPSQVESFKSAARKLGCDEDQAAFDERLRTIVKAPPPRDHKPEKKKSRSK